MNRISLVAILLVGCDMAAPRALDVFSTPEHAEVGWEVDPASPLGPPATPSFDLDIDYVVLGWTATFEISNAPPFETIRVAYGMGGVQQGPCFAFLGGDCVGIGAPAAPMPGSVTTDANGHATFTIQAPMSSPVDYMAFQAASFPSGVVSNVVGTSLFPASTVAVVTNADMDGDGITIDDGDCAENDPSIYPGATDLPGDAVDSNCDGSDGVDLTNVAPLTRNLVPVNHDEGQGLQQWLATSGVDVALQPDGALLRMSQPTGLGPGILLHTLDPTDASPQWEDRTVELLPPHEVGRSRYPATGLLIDMNNDGWDDLLFLRDKGTQDAKGFVYNPSLGQFEALPFNEDHDSDGAFQDGTAAFFGSHDVSYHTRVAARADVDGDGDEDLFVGRRFGNLIFENLTISEDGSGSVMDGSGWTADDASVGTNIAQRFTPHSLDRFLYVNDGNQSSWVVNEWSMTSAVTVATLEGHPNPMFIAADADCYGEYCDDGRGQGPNRFMHVYGLRDASTSCAPANGICEEGENAAADVDCDSGHPTLSTVASLSTEMSCTFVDYLRRPIDGMSATSVAAVDFDSDGWDDDFIVSGLVISTEQQEMSACFDDPTGCGDIPSLGDVVRLDHDTDMTWHAEVLAPPTFDLPYQHVQRFLGVDVNGDGLRELVAIAGITEWGGVHTHLYEPGTMSELPIEGLERDKDLGVDEAMAVDLNGDGNEDLLRVSTDSERWYVSNGTSLSISLRVPATSNNVNKPVLVDLDLDGDLDVVAKTWADTAFDDAFVFAMLNDGTGRFTEAPDLFTGMPIGLSGVVLPLDYDNDGDIDLMMTQTGPMILAQNQLVESGSLSFTDRSDLLPPYYTVGGDIHGVTYTPCDETAAGAQAGQRCYGRYMVADDVDGNGTMDVVLLARKGMNDVLLNNADGSCDPTQPWCARVGFLSAKTDLGIAVVLPVSPDTDGNGFENKAHHAHSVGDVNGDTRTDLVVMATPEPYHSGPADVLFHNMTLAPFPHGAFCTSTADCDAGESCSTTNGLPDLLTCKVAFNDQEVVGGWFEQAVDAFQPRGGADPAAPYTLLGCSAAGDINGDGFIDLAAITTVGETYPDLDGAMTLAHSVCNPFTSSSSLSDCSTPFALFTCYQNACESENPLGYHVGGPGNVFPDTDPQCCVQQELTAPVAAPSCLSLNASDPGRCSSRGFNYTNADPVLRARSVEIFFWIWNPVTGTFDEVAHPIDEPDISGTEALGCALVDMDLDGDMDFVHSGYNTLWVPETRRPSRELPTRDHWQSRRKHRGLNSAFWLNPGWDDPLVYGEPFTQGGMKPLPGKSYFLVAADMDSDGAPEVLQTDSQGVVLWDDASP